jgi:hypothetical protein
MNFVFCLFSLGNDLLFGIIVREKYYWLSGHFMVIVSVSCLFVITSKMIIIFSDR